MFDLWKRNLSPFYLIINRNESPKPAIISFNRRLSFYAISIFVDFTGINQSSCHWCKQGRRGVCVWDGSEKGTISREAERIGAEERQAHRFAFSKVRYSRLVPLELDFLSNEWFRSSELGVSCRKVAYAL